MKHRIPQDDAARKGAPIYRTVLGYFPAAVFELAAHCLDSDRKHNPDSAARGLDPTWNRGKSPDHEDCQMRHLIDAGPRRDAANFASEPAPAGSSAKDARRYHLRANFWRAAALLQEDCELDGAEPGVASRFEAPAQAAPATEQWGLFEGERLLALLFANEAIAAAAPLRPGRRVVPVHRAGAGGNWVEAPATPVQKSALEEWASRPSAAAGWAAEPAPATPESSEEPDLYDAVSEARRQFAPERWAVEYNFSESIGWTASGDLPGVYASEAEAHEAIRTNPDRLRAPLSQWRAVRLP